MARLPGSADSLPVPQPAGGIVRMGQNPKDSALAGIGQSLQGASNDLYVAYEKERQRISDAQAEKAYNQLLADSVELSDGPEGFRQYKGGDAVTKPLLKDYTSKLDDRFTGYVEGLDADTQQKIKSRYDILRLRMSQDILQYQARENEVDQKATFESTVTTEIQQAGLNFREPEKLASSLVRMDAAIERYAEQNGLPSEWVDARKRIHTSEAIENMMVAQIGDDPYKARTMLASQIDGLQEDKRLSLQRTAYAEINRREQAQTDHQARLQDEGEKTIAMLALKGQLDPDTLYSFTEQDLVSPSFALKMEERSHLSGPAFDDASAVFEYRFDPLNYSEQEIALDERLTKETRANLIEQRRELEEDKGNWRRTQDGQEAVRRIEEEFDIYRGVMAAINPEKAKRATRLLTQLYNRVDALPVDQQAISVLDIADELISGVKKTDASEEMNLLLEQKSQLKYKTREEVEKEYERSNSDWVPGSMGKHEREEYLKIIDELDAQIERARNAGTR